MTVRGSGFSSTGNTVRFGVGTISNVRSTDNGTRLTFTVPSRLTEYGSNQSVTRTTYQVSVTNATGHTSNALSFRVTDTDDNNGDIEITSVSGPSSLEVGERGTWTVRVEADDSNYFTFTVDWDDDNDHPYPYAQSQTFSQTNTLSHTYYKEDNYSVRFTVTNAWGASDSYTKTVEVGEDDDNDDERNISIDNMEFDPEVITIDRGTRVVWDNDDNVDHTVTSTGYHYFASGILDPNDSYSHTFNTSGTYTYYCSLHPEMRGTIIVE